VGLPAFSLYYPSTCLCILFLIRRCGRSFSPLRDLRAGSWRRSILLIETFLCFSCSTLSELPFARHRPDHSELLPSSRRLPFFFLKYQGCVQLVRTFLRQSGNSGMVLCTRSWFPPPPPDSVRLSFLQDTEDCHFFRPLPLIAPPLLRICFFSTKARLVPFFRLSKKSPTCFPLPPHQGYRPGGE